MAYLMGIDLGTSSLKTIIVDERGQVQALAARSYSFDKPISGWAEQDPEVWWAACAATIRETLTKSGLSGRDISGVGFSGQMHGLVPLDAAGKPVRPAILHCDARSAQQVREMNRLLGAERVRALTLNPIYTGFLLTSLLWVRENEPEKYSRIKQVCLPKDYIRYRLCGSVACDLSDASATMAFDIRAGRWSDELLQTFGVDRALFPQCFDTCSVVGRITPEAAQATGLGAGVPVVAGGGDQVMQGLGNGVTGTDIVTANIGSSGQVCYQSDTPVLNPALSTNTFCGYRRGRWIVMGAIMHAGLSLKWFDSVLGGVDYAELDAEAAKVRPGSGGVVFLPYLNGERTPHINPDLSGMFLGCNIRTGRGEMARSVMEGVSYALMQCMEICQSLGLHADSVVASGGGAKSPLWLRIQSDVYGLPLRVADTEEQACLGAAIAAGAGTGVYASVEEGCRAAVKYKDIVVEPNAANHEIYEEYYGLFKDAYLANRTLLERATLLGRQAEKE